MIYTYINFTGYNVTILRLISLFDHNLCSAHLSNSCPEKLLGNITHDIHLPVT